MHTFANVLRKRYAESGRGSSYIAAAAAAVAVWQIYMCGRKGLNSGGNNLRDKYMLRTNMILFTLE